MFKNRQEAGKQLGKEIRSAFNGQDLKNSIVLAIPRGGAMVGKAVADTLKADLAVYVVKKIGAQDNPELALGAVGSGGVVFWNEDIIENIGLIEKDKTGLLKEKEKEVEEREKYLGVTVPDVRDKVIIVVDDGVATGSTVITAAMFAKKMRAQKIVLATPLIADDILIKIEKYFDQIIYLLKPNYFHAVGEFYEEFGQVSDEEVKEILDIKN